MKKTLITTLALGMVLSSVSAFADSRDKEVNVPFAPSISAVFHVNERNDDDKYERGYKTVSTSTALTRIKANGDRLIKERLNSLTTNRQAITNTKLTAEQKISLTNVIDSNVTGLTALRASIASSTDATSTKSLVNSIYTTFRIYGIVIPQIRLEKRVYDLENHGLKLKTETFVKIEASIDEQKAKGKDVTAWQKALEDAKVLVTKDLASVTALSGRVAALKPADYGTTTQASINAINKDLKAIEKDFNSIGKLVRKPALKAMRKIVGGGTVIPSPLFGTSWTWVSTVENGTTTLAKNDKFVLEFGEDNHLHSKTDCNTLNGTYTLNGNAFTVGPLMMTMMFCEGSQEGVYGASLSKTTSYAVNGQTLTLTSASGTMSFSKK